jgi:ribosomal protein S18 acetylase RimI-like enzyme
MLIEKITCNEIVLFIEDVATLSQTDEKTTREFQSFKETLEKKPFLKEVIRIFLSKNANRNELHDCATYLAKNKTLIPFPLHELFEEVEKSADIDLSFQKMLLEHPGTALKYRVRQLGRDEIEKIRVAEQVLSIGYFERGYNEAGEIRPFVIEEDSDTDYYIAENENGTLGAMMVTRRLDWEKERLNFYIELIARLPQYPAMKIGESLIQALIQTCPESEISLRVSSMENKRAIKVYKRLGFEFLVPSDTYMVRQPNILTVDQKV